MIIKPNFKNSRKGEKAAALLALSADKGQPYGRCLNPEEMAALVDAQCGKEELAMYMQHLSGCEKCYGEWLALKTMDKTVAGNAAKDRKHPVSRIKKYTVIGSALAVAASVVVFLNLRHPLYMGEDSTSPEIVTMESHERPVALQLNQQADTLKKAEPRAPVEKESLQKMKGLSAPAPQPASRAGKITEQAGLSGAGSASGDVDFWLEELQKNCLSGRQDAEFWTSMSINGQKILENQASSLPKAKVEKVSAALVLLSEMGTKSVTDQCRQLLTLLAEQQKSR